MPRKLKRRAPSRRKRSLRGVSDVIKRLAFRLQPSPPATQRMVLELLRALKWDSKLFCALFGVSYRTFAGWVNDGKFSDPAIKLIWLMHSLILYPERLCSLWDIAQWGRYVPLSRSGRVKLPKSGGVLPPADGSDEACKI